MSVHDRHPLCEHSNPNRLIYDKGSLLVMPVVHHVVLLLSHEPRICLGTAHFAALPSNSVAGSARLSGGRPVIGELVGCSALKQTPKPVVGFNNGCIVVVHPMVQVLVKTVFSCCLNLYFKVLLLQEQVVLTCLYMTLRMKCPQQLDICHFWCPVGSAGSLWATP